MTGQLKERSTGALKLVVILALSAAVSAWVAHSVAEPNNSGGADLLRPAEQTPRKTAQLSEQTLHPAIEGDGSVIQVGKSYEVSATIANTDLAYRLSLGHFTVRALIVGGPTGFNCPWRGLRPQPGGTPQMTCQIPSTIHVIAGLQASMVLAISAPKKVQALPLTAVIGAAQQGQVIVVEASGRFRTQRVTLGASDNQWIAINSGLRPGQRVLLDPTQADLDAS